ncbi:hypothetical protein C8N43_0892 [Litoreibacter ponti]|uniref:PilZ domain-containing protein n=2 Tax=Litoreibacter ponti TaxID=1510457 RepID=A0A2T6BJJ9_9RHOB|nr:hypothetical protein C8N43_0892 [Litoreibacter ponti]
MSFQTGDRAQAQTCVTLPNFEELNVQAAYILFNPIDHFNRKSLRGLLSSIDKAERTSLRASLDARFRAADYAEINATLFDLRRMAQAGLLYERSEMARFARQKNLAARAKSMRQMLDSLCEDPAPSRSSSQRDNKPDSMSAVVSQALRRKQDPPKSSGSRSHSALLWLYTAVGALLVSAIIAPHIVSRIYAKMLRRATCRVSAQLEIGDRAIEGKITRMSLRGLDFEASTDELATSEPAAQIGDRVGITIGSHSLRLRISYMPDGPNPKLGLRILRELDPTQLHQILAMSSIPPVHDPKRRSAT